MSRNRVWKYATIALSVLVAVAVATPAFGGPSLKKLGKQVAALKAQVADVQKQPGPPGPPGPAGSPGPSALRLDFDQPISDNTTRDVGTQNELTIRALCNESGGAARLLVRAESSVAAEINLSAIEDRDSVFFQAQNIKADLEASVENNVFAITPPPAVDFERWEVQAVYRSAARVITLDLHGIANNDTGRCQLQGTAVPTG